MARRIIAYSVLAGAMALSGCASRQQEWGSLKDTPVAARPVAEKAHECAARHIDREAGRSPGGATTLEQKQADDRACAEVYRSPGYLKAQ